MNWLATPAARALASALLHFLWEGAFIALLLAVALWFARGSVRARYAMAVLAMLAMPVIFAATFVLLIPISHEGSVCCAPDWASRADGPPQPSGQSLDFAASLPWAVPLWMAGVLAFYLRSLIGWSAAQRLRRIGVCDPPAEWRDSRMEDRPRTSIHHIWSPDKVESHPAGNPPGSPPYEIWSYRNIEGLGPVDVTFRDVNRDGDYGLQMGTPQPKR
jgi:hypothetical protein